MSRNVMADEVFQRAVLQAQVLKHSNAHAYHSIHLPVYKNVNVGFK